MTLLESAVVEVASHLHSRFDRASLESQLRELAEALGRDDILKLMEQAFGE